MVSLGCSTIVQPMVSLGCSTIIKPMVSLGCSTIVFCKIALNLNKHKTFRDKFYILIQSILNLSSYFATKYKLIFKQTSLKNNIK